jgi:phage virion morphogenesis protein
VLIDTGRLMNSITYGVTPSKLVLSSNLVYSRIHQLGGQAGRGRRVTIPARPYLAFQEEDLQIIADLLLDYLTGEEGSA